MKSKYRWITLSVSLVVLCCLIVTGVAWRSKQTSTSTQLTYTQLPMPHGKDVRRQMVGLDQMNDICTKRISQEAFICNQLHLSRIEKHKRIFAVVDSGTKEMNRVIASHYAKTFDPTVMDRAVQDVSKQ